MTKIELADSWVLRATAALQQLRDTAPDSDYRRQAENWYTVLLRRRDSLRDAFADGDPSGINITIDAINAATLTIEYHLAESTKEIGATA